jgi:endonuclease/exonuclease/phosphatase family metal-dependent hydrolase
MAWKMKSQLFGGLLLMLGYTQAWALLPPKIVIPPNNIQKNAANSHAPVTIGCWNMEWFPGRNPHHPNEHYTQIQINGVKDILNQQNPTIFFACEIRSLDALKKLQLDYPYLACTNFPRPADDPVKLPNQGLAVLSRYPWQEIWALDFSDLPPALNRPPRGILGVKLTLPNNQTLTIYCVHLKSNLGDPTANRAKRESAIDYLEWDWQRRGLDPSRDHLIILGDFNTSVYDPTFTQEQTLRRLLKLGFHDAADGMTEDQRITIPADNKGYPDNDFDHILLSKSLCSQLASKPPWVKIVHVPFTISDHYPLFMNTDAWFAK